MKTLTVDGDGNLMVREVPIPAYTSKQALVKMISGGICGTDHAVIKGKFKGIPLESYPVMLGHEGVGRVVETGSEVTSFKKGDVVLLPFVDAQPSYGAIGSAWGAFSEYGIVNDLAAYLPGTEPECAWGQNIVPPDIDPVEACMIVTFREVYSNVKYFGIKKHDPVVVYGCGPVGLTFIRFLKLVGAKPVIAVARSREKLENALNSGADIALNSRMCNIREEIKKQFPAGVPYVLDAVGSQDVVNEAMGIIADRGEILCYGVPKTEQLELDFSAAPYNWKLNFQQFPKKAEEKEVYEEILGWLRSKELKCADFISDYYSFQEIVRAFDDYKAKKITKKGVIRFD